MSSRMSSLSLEAPPNSNIIFLFSLTWAYLNPDVFKSSSIYFSKFWIGFFVKYEKIFEVILYGLPENLSRFGDTVLKMDSEYAF
jgi:hypothetical protein